MDETDHRPWPLPDAPWVMAQTLCDQLFVHWPVPARALREHVPAGLELDQRDGSGWLGMSPFQVASMRVRGLLPLPLVSRYCQLNVRTYVTRGGRPGIWFFSLDVSSRLVAEVARLLYRLPYLQAEISLERRDGRILCESVRDEANAFSTSYRPTGDAAPSEPGSLEHFLTERYCVYVEHRGELRAAEIHHRPWSLQRADVTIDLNTMPPPGIEIENEPLSHYSARQDVLIWPLSEAVP